MKQANVAVIEDYESMVELAKARLIGTEHEIVAIGRTLLEGLEILDKMHQGKIPAANVFIIDFNLGQESHGRDGRTLIDRMRELGLAGYRINSSADPQPDVHIDKGKGIYAQLDEVLDGLSEQVPDGS